MSRLRRDPNLVPAYVRTQGQTAPSRSGLTLTTLVRTADLPLHGLDVEARRVMQICQGQLVIAEIASLLRLPPTVAVIVVSQLLDSGHLHTPPPIPDGQPDTSLIEDVLHGLRALKV
ncbi:DUF742 domain-containing protein [Streptomyces sp. BK205]|uniref:DUF742 domain-containing protein n=1 Tax=Streptomyces sp. BK205 TaxID=2512164 RepID=UPI00104614FC|nr:DUF742 domain-containing protein [Streptomyces sp. BK205]TCR22927.1 uncharacterized protein DUF742 [Streptomyces sp. BK205]